MPNNEGFYFAFMSGVTPIQQVRLHDDPIQGVAEELARVGGTLPDTGWHGIGVFASSVAITAVEPVTFERLWAVLD